MGGARGQTEARRPFRIQEQMPSSRSGIQEGTWRCWGWYQPRLHQQQRLLQEQAKWSRHRILLQSPLLPHLASQQMSHSRTQIR